MVYTDYDIETGLYYSSKQASFQLEDINDMNSYEAEIIIKINEMENEDNHCYNCNIKCFDFFCCKECENQWNVELYMYDVNNDGYPLYMLEWVKKF